MIKYSLTCKSSYCSKKNNFDGWFQNIEAYQNQKSRGLIICPLCGSSEIIKLLTAPSFRLSKLKSPELEVEKKVVVEESRTKNFTSSNNVNDFSILLRAIKKEIKKNSEFVGNNFVKEVRSMKIDKTTQRAIYGHGTKKEIEELKEEGINILNLPWTPEDH